MKAMNLFGSFPGTLPDEARLGQAPLTGLSYGYNEASRWLADAEKVAAANPSCDLPIITTFRMFVNGTPNVDKLSARLNLGQADIQSLTEFNKCSVTQPGATVAAIQAAAAQEAEDRKNRIIGLGAAALALGVLGYFITRS